MKRRFESKDGRQMLTIDQKQRGRSVTFEIHTDYSPTVGMKVPLDQIPDIVRRLNHFMSVESKVSVERNE